MAKMTVMIAIKDRLNNPFQNESFDYLSDSRLDWKDFNMINAKAYFSV